MTDPFLVPITMAIGATTLVLVAGIAGLARPLFTPVASNTKPCSSPPKVSRSNQLMRARVIFQAIAVVLILAGAAHKKAHRNDHVAVAAIAHAPPETVR